jgi:hypothetical protein
MPAGGIVYIADGSFWRKSPALIVYDTATRRSRRLLEAHGSVRAQNWLIRTPIREMRFLRRARADEARPRRGRARSHGQWLHFGAMAHDTLYRVPTSACWMSS